MPFASYAAIGDVIKAHHVVYREVDFVEPLALTPSESLRTELAFAHAHVSLDSSEFAVCENLIYPILREVWKYYTDDLALWSHMPVYYNPDLSGTPDYVLARRSPLGKVVFDKPYLLVVEAKKDDPSRGWGQCLATMLAAQKLNELPEQTLYGITTNGRSWEFGKLQATTFTRDHRLYLLQDLDHLCGAVRYVFEQCRQQLVGQPCAP